jgi:hypothetical protein
MSGTQRIERVWQYGAAVGLFVLAGCAPAYGPAGVEFAVRAPPRNLVEVRVASPGPRYVWIAGHYGWQGGNYAWVSGRWDLPPQPRQRWVAGHWVHARQGWYWVEGRWR